MMAALWSDTLEDISSAKKHFRQAVTIFAEGKFEIDTSPDYVREMAFLHAMQSGYTSFEAGLRRMFVMLGEDLPVGSDSHAVMLRRASRPLDNSRPLILDNALFLATDELRRFRHVAMHTYDFFDGKKAATAVEAAELFVAEIDPAIARFRAVIDPD